MDFYGFLWIPITLIFAARINLNRAKDGRWHRFECNTCLAPITTRETGKTAVKRHETTCAGEPDVEKLGCSMEPCKGVCLSHSLAAALLVFSSLCLFVNRFS
jgi:hypothetical protein